MDSKDYHANYFRPEKPLRVFMLVRVWRHMDGSTVHDGTSARCEVIDHTVCEREVYSLGVDGRSRAWPHEYFVCEWTPHGGLSDFICVELGGRIADWKTVIPSTLHDTLCERAAVLAVVANLGCDLHDGDNGVSRNDINAYLAHR